MPKLYITAALLTASALCLPATAAAEAMPGTWKLHPTFDSCSDIGTYANHVEKIMDGPRFVFIWANAAPFQTNYYPYFYQCGTLWYIDKGKMDSAGGKFEVKHISELAPTNAMGIQYADYNPKGGYITTVGTDGSVEIIYEDGRVVKGAGMSDFGTATGPAAKVSHLTFDDERGLVYGAAGRHAFALDPATGILTDILTADRDLQSIIRVGDQWMACDEETIYTADATAGLPSSFDSFKILPIIGSALPSTIKGGSGYEPWDKYTENQFPMPWRLMPVSDDVFFVLMKNRIPSNKTGITTSTGELAYYTFTIARLNDGQWKPHHHHSLTISSGDIAQFPNHPVDQALHISEAGISVSGYNITYKYDFKNGVYNHATGAWTKAPASQLQFIPQTNPGSGTIVRTPDYDWQRRTCSYDHSRFWLYYPMHGFYYRDYLGTASGTLEDKWSKDPEVVLPNAPAVFYADDFFSHPEHGMLIRNISRSQENAWTGCLGDQLSAFKDGKWTRKGAVAVNDQLGGLYISTSQAGRIDLPDGIAADPVNPDWIYCGSYRDGITRLNLSDPNDMLTLTRSGKSTLITSKLEEVVPAFASDKSNAYCSKPAFDNNGVMWTSYFDYAAGAANYDTHAYLYYWLPEDRAAVKSAADYAAHPMKRIVLDNSSSMHLCHLIPLTSPGNETKLVYMPNNQDKAKNWIQIFDHKGTLDDTSDDELITMKVAKDEAGGQIDITYNFTPVEDPTDGRVWIPCAHGLLWFHPSEVISGSDYIHQLDLSGDALASKEGVTSFYNMEVRQVSFDGQGRKWIATENNGIFVLSPDAQHLVAHFTTDNSDLPSDNIFGSGWDYATNSMFISTGGGLMQFTPAETMDSAAAETVHAFPSRILPGFKGHVDITGVPAAATLSICDEQGNEIDRLGASSNGRVQWHPASSGLAEGIYWITDQTGARLEKITVLK